ncbi:MAG: PEP-CTERM sorting domain-containing protein [Phycisphaerales bacterium]|nr:PEP-CTERM sorting domain-containing protein [Phycisphaerales bacterium]
MASGKMNSMWPTVACCFALLCTVFATPVFAGGDEGGDDGDPEINIDFDGHWPIIELPHWPIIYGLPDPEETSTYDGPGDSPSHLENWGESVRDIDPPDSIIIADIPPLIDLDTKDLFGGINDDSGSTILNVSSNSVPAPGVIGLLTVAGLAGGRRRRRR